MNYIKIIGGAFAVSLLLTPASVAQEADASAILANCMLENTTSVQENLLKDLMVAALKDAPAAELQNKTMGFGMSMITLATSTCELGIDELQGPVFEGAAAIYGEEMGAKIMSKAMAKIG